ncbi:MAG: hypothetical protein H8E13_06300 [Actinobacteria bacterium]|nr:hypothetical protein [Actinomycetota bacterium]
MEGRWSESYYPYPGRSGRNNCQKSAEAIVPASSREGQKDNRRRSWKVQRICKEGRKSVRATLITKQ